MSQTCQQATPPPAARTNWRRLSQVKYIPADTDFLWLWGRCSIPVDRRSLPGGRNDFASHADGASPDIPGHDCRGGVVAPHTDPFEARTVRCTGQIEMHID